MYRACMKDGHTEESAGLHKVTVNLIPEAWDAANATSKRRGITRTDAINRALQAYAFLEAEIDAGSEILIRRKDGEAQTVKFL